MAPLRLLARAAAMSMDEAVAVMRDAWEDAAACCVQAYCWDCPRAVLSMRPWSSVNELPLVASE
eukprot:9729773-Heterocapsa_arctica.AAC.1